MKLIKLNQVSSNLPIYININTIKTIRKADKVGSIVSLGEKGDYVWAKEKVNVIVQEIEDANKSNNC